MGDVHDADTALLQMADDSMQNLDFAAAERGGGLVHDDQLRTLSHGARNLDHLLLRNAQPANLAARIDLQAQTSQYRAGIGMHALPIDQTTARGLAADV